MSSSLLAHSAYKAIALGLRIPFFKRVQDFHQQSRTIDEIKQRGINLVLDVGANRGYYGKHLRMIGYSGRIFSFEPDPATYARLTEMTSGDDDWRTFNCALGDRPGSILFHVIKSGDETVLSSILPPLAHQVHERISVPINTVRRVLELECALDSSRIFLKMDTQGYDLNVFAGAAEIASIQLLQSEVSVIPLYENMPHYTEALLHYEQSGFGLLDLFVVNRDEKGAVLEYDALMARNG